MLWLEFPDFQFNRNKAGQCSMIKQQVNIKVLPANLYTVFLTNKGKILSKFKNELFQILHDGLTKILFGILFRQVQKLKNICIEDTASHVLRDRFWNQLLGRKHRSLIIGAVHLPFQFPFGVMLFCAKRHIKMPFFR